MALSLRLCDQGKARVHPNSTGDVQFDDCEDEPSKGSWVSSFHNSFGLQFTIKQRVIISVVVVCVIIVLSISIAIPLSVTSGESSVAASRGTNRKTTDFSKVTTSIPTTRTTNGEKDDSSSTITGTATGATNDTTNSVAKDFRSCAQRFAAGFTNSGVYEILTPNNQTINVSCDHGNADGDSGWTMVFKVVSGVTLPRVPHHVRGPSGLWLSSVTLESSSSSLPINSSSRQHYKNRIIEQWQEFNPTQVRLSLYENKTEVFRLVFNAKGSSKTNWFARDRLLTSPWTDIHSQPINYFSIDGDIQVDYKRTFFINSEYDDCPNDRGWMALIETVPGVCIWEGHVQKYSIIYSTNSTRVLWITTGAVSMADMMAIYIL